MVNTYISDVFFAMDHGYNPDAPGDIGAYEHMDDNAEMLITMLTELDADSLCIPTVDELKDDFFDRI